MEGRTSHLLDRVLVIAPWVGERNAEALVTEKFLHVLAQTAGRLTVVTQHQPEWTVCPCPENLMVRSIPLDQCPRAKQPLWYNLCGVARQSTAGWDWAFAVADWIPAELQAEQYTLLISRYLPPEGALAGYLVRQKVTLPWWCILNDPFPGWCQNSVNPLTWNCVRVWRDSWFVRSLMQTPQAVFTYPAWHMRNHTIDRLKLSPEISNRIEVLYHVGIPDHLRAFEERLEDGPLFRYFGGFYGYRDPCPLIAGWQRFQESGGGDCTLEIYGNEGDRLTRLIDQVGARNVRLQRPVPYREACRLAQQPCVLLHVDPNPNRFREGIWVASKLADSIATGNILCGWVPSKAEAREIAVNAGTRAFWASTYTALGFAVAFQQARAEFLCSPIRMARTDVFSERSVRGQIVERVGRLANMVVSPGMV